MIDNDNFHVVGSEHMKFISSISRQYKVWLRLNDYSKLSCNSLVPWTSMREI